MCIIEILIQASVENNKMVSSAVSRFYFFLPGERAIMEKTANSFGGYIDARKKTEKTFT